MTTYNTVRLFGATALSAVLWIAAIASIAASAYLGFAYGNQFGLAFGVIAVCAEVFKPVALQLGLRLLGTTRFYLAPILLGFAFVCVAYSVLAELGLAALTRGDVVAERGARAIGAEQAKEARQRALADLALLKPTKKSVGEYEADKASWHRLQGKNSPWFYEGDLARAKRRAELEAKIASLPAAPATVADPLADVLALLYADATGLRVDVPTLSKRLYLLPVLLIEVCSTFGLLLAMLASEGLRGSVGTVQPSKVDRPIVQSSILMDGPRAYQRPMQPSQAKFAAQHDLLAYIAQHRAVPSQQFLCDRWGVGSKQTVSNWLRDWERKGLITRHQEGRVKVTSNGRSTRMDGQLNGGR